ncbi:MAG: oligosaccharide flippase family protein, partial [candidate division KSB1 bacterium]|nr:oligosaccharide flippase family protein [candidate division KSB1 bacterium]MDZ7293864.1 oligosaccharide flippase family protein [candidate division KSB1 bacterium]MDZ7377884.1 oligosaccharide flippase family protein [candidate division KSB1 bacterium]MDZ7385693.1 oligosaccharide flippase family protein [candidate division KSB1 bacterium]MDZ7391598.1 oligosaccharide flippase family protein [candidate division KSB1 bacterium]
MNDGQGSVQEAELFARRPLYGDILLSVGGRTVAAALTFVKTVVLVRLLAPPVYGQVAVLLAWGYIASGATELGCGAAFIVLESGAPLDQQHRRFWRFVRTRLLVSATLMGAWVCTTLLGVPPRSALTGAALLFGLGQNVCHTPEFLYQVQRRFAPYARFVVWVALVQLAWSTGALAAYRVWHLSDETLWWLLALAPWSANLVGLVPLALQDRRLLAPQIGEDWAYLKTMVAFGKWVALCGLLAYVYQRWAVIALGKTGNPEAAGAYDVALTCGQVVNMLTLAAVSALSPRFAATHERAAVRRGLVRLFTRGGPVVALVLVVYYLVRRTVIGTVFGPHYLASIVPLDALMPSFVLTLLTLPMVAYTTYGLRAPQVVFWVALGRTALLVLGAYPATQHYGVLGLAVLQSALGIGEHLLVTLYALYAPRRSR